MTAGRSVVIGQASSKDQMKRVREVAPQLPARAGINSVPPRTQDKSGLDDTRDNNEAADATHNTKSPSLGNPSSKTEVTAAAAAPGKQQFRGVTQHR